MRYANDLDGFQMFTKWAGWIGDGFAMRAKTRIRRRGLRARTPTLRLHPWDIWDSDLSC